MNHIVKEYVRDGEPTGLYRCIVCGKAEVELQDSCKTKSENRSS